MVAHGFRSNAAFCRKQEHCRAPRVFKGLRATPTRPEIKEMFRKLLLAFLLPKLIRYVSNRMKSPRRR